MVRSRRNTERWAFGTPEALGEGIALGLMQTRQNIGYDQVHLRRLEEAGLVAAYVTIVGGAITQGSRMRYQQAKHGSIDEFDHASQQGVVDAAADILEEVRRRRPELGALCVEETLRHYSDLLEDEQTYGDLSLALGDLGDMLLGEQLPSSEHPIR